MLQIHGCEQNKYETLLTITITTTTSFTTFTTTTTAPTINTHHPKIGQDGYYKVVIQSTILDWIVTILDWIVTDSTSSIGYNALQVGNENISSTLSSISTVDKSKNHHHDHLHHNNDEEMHNEHKIKQTYKL